MSSETDRRESPTGAPGSPSAPWPGPQRTVPPLENGDRLSAAEFERRYDAMPELKKAELVEGVVYMPSPVRFDSHGEQQADLITWLGVYRSATPGVRVGDNSSLRLDMGNMPQPDAVMIIDPTLGGQAQISADGYLTAAPELAAEVTASTVALDLGAKLELYRRVGVREYVVWRVLDQAVDWFVRRGDRFEPRAPDAAGRLTSEIFHGLWLDPAALVRGDIAAVLDVLRQGIAGPEHAAFLAELRRKS